MMLLSRTPPYLHSFSPEKESFAKGYLLSFMAEKKLGLWCSTLCTAVWLNAHFASALRILANNLALMILS